MQKITVSLFFVILFSSCKNHSTGDKTNTNDSTLIIVEEDTTKYKLTACYGAIENDELSIKVTGGVGFDLTIQKKKDTTYSELSQNWAITDSSFMKSIFKTVYQNIFFNKNVYSKGDPLSANVSMKLIGYHTFPSVFIDTITVSGRIRLAVE